MTGNLDPSSSFIDSPQVSKQMATLAAANQARMSQNSRPTPSPLSVGTNSGTFVGSNSHSYPSGSHDLLSNSANGHATFPISNNFGLPQNPSVPPSASFLDPAMSQPNVPRSVPGMKDTLKIREQNFMQSLASTFAKRGQPLPHFLTGLSVPGFDPNNTQWAFIEPGSEVGHFRLANKDVNIFKLWGMVMQQGGIQAVRFHHHHSIHLLTWM
jgi:SWI/SNF chromatin-remodeling complex subunit SWI1